MPLLRMLLWTAVQRVVTDPRTRQLAFDVIRRAKPTVSVAVRELRSTAREINPRQAPEAFARRLRERLRTAMARPHDAPPDPEILPPNRPGGPRSG